MSNIPKIGTDLLENCILGEWADEVATIISELQSEIEALKEQVSKLEIAAERAEVPYHAVPLVPGPEGWRLAPELSPMQANMLYTCTVCGHLCDPKKEEIWRHATGMQHVRCVEPEDL